MVTVVGPSGSGKSTFLNIAGLLDRPTTGRICINGLNVAEMSERERSVLRARSIGFVFQSYHLVGYHSLLDNVMMSGLYAGVARRARRQAAARALDRVGLGSRAYDPVRNLSGGQRQRVAIARAIASDPALVLCDEPTGNLDSMTAAGILELLSSLQREGTTVVIVTHDSTIASIGGQRITIHDGVVRDS